VVPQAIAPDDEKHSKILDDTTGAVPKKRPFCCEICGISGEPPGVLVLLLSLSPVTLVHRLVQRRLELKKTRLEFVQETGVSVKTLEGWEHGRRHP